MELKYQLELKVNNFIFLNKKIDFIFLLAAPIIAEEPLSNKVLDKTPLSNLLATPAVRRMAKELQVKRNGNNFFYF
jgi:hypothetical protein